MTQDPQLTPHPRSAIRNPPVQTRIQAMMTRTQAAAMMAMIRASPARIPVRVPVLVPARGRAFLRRICGPARTW